MIKKQQSVKLPFDMDYLIRELGSRETALKILLRYSNHTKKQVEKLKQAIIDRHIPEIHRIAHSIKGGAMNIRAGNLSNKARDLEKAATLENLEMAECQLDEILNEFNDVNYYINEITREN